MLFFGPSAALILPVYAVNILHIGPERLGLLFSSSGLGAIAGSLLAASMGDVRRKGMLYFAGMLLWVAALAAFAVSEWLWLSMLALAVFGMGQTLAGATTITLLQTRVAGQMRGRMMSLITLLVMGVRPLGDFPAGTLIAVIGGPGTVLLSSAAVGAYGLFVFLTHPTVRSAASLPTPANEAVMGGQS
jgi:predicted MFS family arabinose efflux permease